MMYIGKHQCVKEVVIFEYEIAMSDSLIFGVRTRVFLTRLWYIDGRHSDSSLSAHSFRVTFALMDKLYFKVKIVGDFVDSLPNT